MFTAQQAREAQQAQEAIQAAMATEEARKKEAEDLIAAEALAAKNILDGEEIFEKAQVAIKEAAVTVRRRRLSTAGSSTMALLPSHAISSNFLASLPRR